MADSPENKVLGWDDEIQNDGEYSGEESVVLPEGSYDFEVIKTEQAWYDGSTKIPACNKAVLTLTVEHEGASVNVKTDIILYKTIEWKISAFFRCIGLKKHGEKLKMKWNEVVGRTGRAHFKPREGRDGRQFNDVDRFLDPDIEVDAGDTPWGGF